MTIETTRPELLPACVALVAHPDDERYQPLFGTTVRTPLFGVEVPVLAHHLAEPDKGSGIAMICTFGDLTDVTWWRELQLPTRRRSSAATAGSCRDAAGRASTRRRTPSSPARPCTRRAKQIVELLRESGDLDGEPRADHAPGEVLREGRQAARDRHHPAVVHPQRRPRRRDLRDALLARGSELDWHPPYMRVRYENWVEGLNGDWLISPAAVLRRAVPGLVPARRRRRARLRRRRSLPDESALPVDPSSDAPPGYDETSAASRAASSATPTSWTPGRRRRSPRRSPAAGRSTTTCSAGCSRWTCGRRRTTSSAPGCSRRSCARTSSTTRCRGRNAGDLAAGSSTPTARRCRSPRATSSRRSTLLEEYGSDAVRYWAASGAARHRHRVRHRPDEDRPPAGDQAAQRVEVRARLRRDAPPTVGRRHRSARPGAARAAGRRRRRRRPRLRRATTTPARWSGPRRSSGRSATTTSSWSRTAPTASAATAQRRRRARRCAIALVGAAAAVRAVPAVRHRRGLVVVAARARCTARRGRRVG